MRSNQFVFRFITVVFNRLEYLDHGESIRLAFLVFFFMCCGPLTVFPRDLASRCPSRFGNLMQVRNVCEAHCSTHTWNELHLSVESNLVDSSPLVQSIHPCVPCPSRVYKLLETVLHSGFQVASILPNDDKTRSCITNCNNNEIV